MSSSNEERLKELQAKIQQYTNDLQKVGYEPFEIAGSLAVVGVLQIEALSHKDATVQYLKGLIAGIQGDSGSTVE
jgi:hypothetical protein